MTDKKKSWESIVAYVLMENNNEPTWEKEGRV